MRSNLPDGVTDADCEPRQAMSAMEEEEASAAAQGERDANGWLQTVERAVDSFEDGTDEEPGEWTCPDCGTGGNVGKCCAACGENLYRILREALARLEAARCGAL